MKAAVLKTAPGELEIEDVEVTAPQSHEVHIKTHACGLCHSDLHVMDATLPVPMPSVLGHEAAGEVLAVGDAVTEFAPGDRVVACLSMFCGECAECSNGRTWLCLNRRQVANREDGSTRLRGADGGVNQMTGVGGFAEEMLLHQNAIVKVPNEIPLDRAALLGCAVVTGVGSAMNAAKVQPGTTVAVIGCGGIGLNIVQGSAISGSERIIAVDLQPEKLELAKVFGATDVVNPNDGDPIEAVRELTGGGVDYAFEAIGLPVTAGQAFAMLKPGQTAYLVGVPPVGSTIELPGAQMCLEARGIQGVFMGSNRFRHDIPMLAQMYLDGKLKLDELISARIGLDDVNEGYETMRAGHAARSVIVFDT